MKLRKVAFALYGLVAAVVAIGCGPDPSAQVQVIDPPQANSHFSQADPAAKEAIEAKNAEKQEASATLEQAKQKSGDTAAPGATPPKDGEKVAVLDTNLGRIVLKFFPKKAPGHVSNFEKLADKKFYDGTKFHRVIPGFMIQGGDPYSKTGPDSMVGQGDPGYKIKAEFNDTHHARGILSMARSNDPDSAGSQFFICVADASSLDGKYTAFGQVVQGMDVVDKIVNLPRNNQDRPTPDEAVMNTVRIETWPLKK